MTYHDKLNLLVNTEASATDVLSDFLQAKKAILFDIRGEAMIPQLSSFGMTIEEVEEALLDLAVWVHKHRTGILGSVLILDEGEIGIITNAISLWVQKKYIQESDEAGIMELLDKLPLR